MKNRRDIIVIAAIIVLLAFAAYLVGIKTGPPSILDCSSCPEKARDVEVFEYKYVCFNGSVVDSKEECFTQEEVPVYNPSKSYEEGTYIQSVEVRPTCIAGYKGGNIQYILKTLATNVTAQVKHMDGPWEDVFTTSAAFNDFIDFIICTKERKCFKGDFELKPDTAYLIRLRFEARKNAGGIAFSNEHVIDTTEVSNYTQTDCAKATYYR